MEVQLFTILAISVMFLSSTTTAFILSSSQCLAPSPCTCSGSYVRCDSKSLTDVPRFLPSGLSDRFSVLYIYLMSNKLITVPDKAFQNFSSINTSNLYFYINSNKISSIHQTAFAGVENKTFFIDLSSNNLTSLPTALSTISSLHTLNLRNNPIKALDPSVISHLSHSLSDLSFTMSAFQSWPSVLSNLNNLRSLTVEHIPFNHLSLDAFAGMESSLTSLSMSYSLFLRIPSAICHLRNLQTLNFDHNAMLENNFTLFEPCQHKLAHLTTLSLQSNRLTSFPDVLHSFPSITQLNLGYNLIRFIHTNTIPFTNRITHLDLRSNRFSHIPFAVNKMKNLQYLYISNNDIVTIEDSDLTGLADLRALDIYNNPIEYVAPRAFKHNGLLRNLELENTKLTTIPEAVLSLPNLSYFPFTGNHVKCTCAMSYLKGWNVTRISTFTGNCENQQNELIKQYILTSLKDCP